MSRLYSLRTRVALAAAGALMAAGVFVAVPTAPVSAAPSAPQATIPLPPADISVKAIKKIVNGDRHTYVFTVKNTGQLAAPNVTLYKGAQINDKATNAYVDMVDDGYFTMSLQPGVEHTIQVNCKAPAGQYCYGGLMFSQYSKDPNGSNDLAWQY